MNKALKSFNISSEDINILADKTMDLAGVIKNSPATKTVPNIRRDQETPKRRLKTLSSFMLSIKC